MALLKITERNGRDILEWLDEVAVLFDAQLEYHEAGDNPYSVAANEIRALRRVTANIQPFTV